MAVTFEAAVATAGSGTYNTSVSTTITLGAANTSRAILIALQFDINTVSGVTVTIGGQNCALIANTDSGTDNSNFRSMLFGLALGSSGLTGSQTISASWTTDSAVVIGAISALGVNQSTPFNNGTFFSSLTPETSYNISITSNSGDLTSSFITYVPSGATTNQTIEWTGSAGSDLVAGQDIGSGTGTTTHTWTRASGISYVVLAGANFVQASSSKATITGHSAVTGNLKGKGVLASPLAGHATLHATLSGLVSTVVGHSVVTGNLKGKGVLAGSSTGHATVVGHPPAASSHISGHASITAVINGSGSLIGKFSKIVLQWTAAIDPVDGYDVFRGPSSGAESTVPLNSSLIVGTSFTDGSPLPGNNFYTVESSLGGVLSLAANEEGILSAGSAISGRSTVVASLANSASHISSHITGHSSISASITGLGKRASSVTGHALVNQFPKGVLTGVGALASSITGQSVIFADAHPSIYSIILGHTAVSGVLKAKGVLIDSVTGHSVVSGNIKALGKISSSIAGRCSIFGSVQAVSIHGHSVVSGAISGKTGLVDSVSGHSSLTALLKATGGISSTITGQASVIAQGTAALAKCLGKATLTASLNVADVSNINGRATIFANLGSIALQGCVGRAVVHATIGGVSSNLSALCAGRSSVSGSATHVNRHPVIRKFGVSVQNPYLITTNTNNLMIFAEQFKTSMNPPAISSPNGVGRYGQDVMPQELLILPGSGISQSGLYTVLAEGTVTIPAAAANPTFSIVLSQNYFGLVNGKPALTSSVPLLTLPVYTNQSVPSGVTGWSISCLLPGNLGFTQLSIGVQFGGTILHGSSLFQAILTNFEIED